MLLYYSLASALPFLAPAAAQTWPTNLVGTWSTKSNKTITGPGFYNPIADEFIEPERTGISYSFTGDGHYEEAYYRAIANPVNPACPGGIMQFQHGTWTMEPNGSLILQPIADDGRQLLSQPCEGNNAVYSRYNQSELFTKYLQYTDPYHNIPRLDLYQFNGAVMQPLYLVMSPPQMLPTTTLNPVGASSTPSSSAAAGRKMAKRGLGDGPAAAPEVPLNWKATLGSRQHVVQLIDADRLWWVGLAMTGVGGLLYLGPRRMGIQL